MPPTWSDKLNTFEKTAIDRTMILSLSALIIIIPIQFQKDDNKYPLTDKSGKEKGVT